MKLRYKILIGIGIIIVLGYLIWFANGLIKITTNASRIDAWCKSKNISHCYLKTPECFNDCKELGMEYFKWIDGGFSRDGCVCKLRNETKSIW